MNYCIKLFMLHSMLIACGHTYAMDWDTKENAALEAIESDLPDLIDDNNVSGVRNHIAMYNIDPNRTMQLTKYKDGILIKNTVPLLIYSIEMRRPKIATLLLELGADPNAIDAQGVSALVYAQKYGYNDLAQQIINYDKQIAYRNKLAIALAQESIENISNAPYGHRCVRDVSSIIKGYL